MVTLGFGIVTASILALSAVAFTLQYGVTNVANVSHGEVLTIGAYAAYLVHQRTGSAVAAAIAGALAGGVAALAMYSVLIGPFIFFGAANVAYTIDPGAPQQLGPFLLTPLDLKIVGSAIAITVVLYVVISR